MLASVAARVVAGLPDDTVLVEYGASDETKARSLLGERATGKPAISAYVPIDVAASALRDMQRRLRTSDPDLVVHAIAADFQQPIMLPERFAGRPRLGFFPGSTIGNLAPAAALRFLALARQTLGDSSQFLIGADLRKDPARLVPAYDDAAGVTAAFNKNLLVRLNREAGANFDVSAFAHRAIWNDFESRIEMHLESLRDQWVTIGGETVGFTGGETIHTENSYKYTPQKFVRLANDAGWKLDAMWTNPERLFAMYLLAPAS